MNDTIFALATAQGKAGIAVIRLSGPLAVSTAERLCGPLAVPGRSVRSVVDLNGVVLDEALVLSFAKDRSFTGEETVEFHLHGSPAIVSSVLRVFGDMDGLRQAEAGEFTRRALDNGRLDLTQVEGLADLIDAETEAQRIQALRVFTGELGKIVEGWRAQLIHAAALIEATIDFADEDVPIDVRPEVEEHLRKVQSEMLEQIEGVQAAERVRSGFEVAIVGAPNVGKSTLLNRLARRDAAITSEIAGTTRDVIEVQMDIAGFPVTLLDTAGLRDSSDVVESIGIERGRRRAEAADIRVYLIDKEEEIPSNGDQDDIVVWAKSDIVDAKGFAISAKTGEGLDALVDQIGLILRCKTASVGLAIRERHRVALIRGRKAIEAVLTGLDYLERDADLMAEELRVAIRDVESLVGRVDVEDILGEIFSSFCIGK